MLDWLNQYSGAFNAAFNLAMVAIWLIYFQLLMHSYRRHRQTKILISRYVDMDGETHCVVANMSPEPLFLDLVVASVDFGGERREGAIGDTAGQRDSGSIGARRADSLAQGATRDLGSFAEIVAELAPDKSQAAGPVTMELTVIGIYGPEDKPVGASRSFCRSGSDSSDFRPRDVETRQARKRDERKHLWDLMRRFGTFEAAEGLPSHHLGQERPGIRFRHRTQKGRP